PLPASAGPGRVTAACRTDHRAARHVLSGGSVTVQPSRRRAGTAAHPRASTLCAGSGARRRIGGFQFTGTEKAVRMTRVPSPVPHRSIAIAPRRPARRPRALALLTGTLLAAGALGSAGAGAEPAIGGSSDADYGNGCVVTAGDKARTMDSLRSHCT